MDINSLPAVVTGGASGLGEATARRLAAQGAKVTIFDLNEERGKIVAAEIGGHFERVNVTDEENVMSALENAASKHGEARILVNCAGIVVGEKTVGRDNVPHSLANFSKAINVNLIGTYNVIRLTAARMVDLEELNEDHERGVIINTASIAAMDGQIGQAAYAASKAGIAGLTLPVARDLARFGIRVCTIAPGIFITPMMSSLTEEVQEALGAAVPFPSRMGKPEEYAQLAQQICENRMLNGEVIRLDGAIRLAPR